MTKEIFKRLAAATAELACPTCHNQTKGREDECPECHGEGRNVATIHLLEALSDAATGYVRKIFR